MRILITGVSGFVGRRLAERCLADGDPVVGTRRADEPEASTGIDSVLADLLDEDSLVRAIEHAAPEVIVHFAGLSHVGASWKAVGTYFQVNTLGTENLVRAAGAVPVIFASSAEVYGPVPENDQPIAEDRPLDPPSPYALTKAAAERFVLGAGGIVARSFNLIGPGQSDRFALPSFAAQLAAIRRDGSEPILSVGNLSARRDFVHVDDAVDAFVVLARRAVAGERREVYNIASGVDRTLRQALDTLIEVSGIEATVRVAPERVRPVDVPLLRGDATRLNNLGWRPARGFDRAVADLWSWTVEQAPGLEDHRDGRIPKPC